MDLREEVIKAWKNNGYTRREILKLWRERKGPFLNDERDQPGEVQIMPFPQPPIDQQVGP